MCDTFFRGHARSAATIHHYRKSNVRTCGDSEGDDELRLIADCSSSSSSSGLAGAPIVVVVVVVAVVV